jgi:SAM-dependent methyltransferase
VAYEPATFWADPAPGMMGPWDPDNPHASPDHDRQEVALIEVLESESLFPAGFESVFEAGCGFGRLSGFFATWYPEVAYHAIDVGSRQLESARRFHPQGTFERADLLTYEPVRWYDLVLTSEVLMHVRPPDLVAAFRQLVRLTAPAGRIVVVEWVPIPGMVPAEVAYWNFPHDYERLFADAGVEVLARVRTGLQMIYVLARE